MVAAVAAARPVAFHQVGAAAGWATAMGGPMPGGERGAPQCQHGTPPADRHCGQLQLGRCTPGCFWRACSNWRSSRRRRRSRRRRDRTVLSLSLRLESESESMASLPATLPLPFSTFGAVGAAMSASPARVTASQPAG